MSIELWFAFVVACIPLLAVPGPTVLLVVSYALSRGKSSAWATVPGVALGDFTAMTVSLIGAGAVLATSATLFTALKLIGAAYLIWLGIKLWRSDPEPGAFDNAEAASSTKEMFWSAYIVTALNPKSIVFFVAFVPQFVNTSASTLHQFVVLEITFLVLATISAALWAVLAGQARLKLRQPKTLKLVNRTGGGFLIGAGIITAAIRV